MKTVRAALESQLGRVDTAGESFGILKVRIGEDDFDVSLPRRESQTGAHHTDSEVIPDGDMSSEEVAARSSESCLISSCARLRKAFGKLLEEGRRGWS